MFMLRITTSGTFTKADTEVFHLETVIVYNLSTLFWAQSGFDMFLQCQKRGGGFNRVQLRKRSRNKLFLLAVRFTFGLRF